MRWEAWELACAEQRDVMNLLRLCVIWRRHLALYWREILVIEVTQRIYIKRPHQLLQLWTETRPFFKCAFLHKYKTQLKAKSCILYSPNTKLGLAFLKSQLLGSKRPNKRALIPNFLIEEKVHNNYNLGGCRLLLYLTIT